MNKHLIRFKIAKWKIGLLDIPNNELLTKFPRLS